MGLKFEMHQKLYLCLEKQLKASKSLMNLIAWHNVEKSSKVTGR